MGRPATTRFNSGLVISGVLILASFAGPLALVRSADAQSGGYRSIVVGGDPTAAVYDASNGYIYVATHFAGTVVVLSGGNVIANMSLAKLGYPQFLAYDPLNNYVYVSMKSAEFGPQFPGTVSVISGTKVVANITVGLFPGSIIYDPSNGYVYCVTQDLTGQSDVWVLSGTQTIATVKVGLDAGFEAVDTDNGYVFVSNFGSASVSIISGVQLLGNVTVGLGPQDMVYDPASGQMFVALNTTPPELAVISGTTLLTLMGGLQPPLVYDPADQMVYAISGSVSANVSVLSGANVVATIVPTEVPGANFGYNRFFYNPYDSQVYLYKSEPNPVFGRLLTISGTSITSSTDLPSSLALNFLLASPGDHDLYVTGYTSNSLTLIPSATTSSLNLVYAVPILALVAAAASIAVLLGVRYLRRKSPRNPKVI